MASLRGRRLLAGNRAVSTGARMIVAALALSLLACSPAAAASQAQPRGADFTLSPIAAVALPTLAATRYSVSVKDVPTNDAPAYTWYLHLSGAAGATCDDAILAGGTRLGADEYVWRNQGPSFVWYHGAVHSYSSAPAYGCDQARIGVAGYPGTVSVVAENEYEHCEASSSVILAGTTARDGLAASCALGGYTLAPSMLPVPAALLSLYERLDTSLSALVSRARHGTLGAGALVAALKPLLSAQQRAFGQLFPPVWGCSFTRLFDGVLGAKAALGAQIGALAAGARPQASALAGDVADITTVARAVEACAQSPSHAGGAPPSVVAAAKRLAAAAGSLGHSAGGLAGLRTSLPVIKGRLDGLVGDDFPTVFGMRFLDLVDSTIAADSAIAEAEQTATAKGSSAAVSALGGALASDQSVGHALHVQQKRVVAHELGHS